MKGLLLLILMISAYFTCRMIIGIVKDVRTKIKNKKGGDK